MFCAGCELHIKVTRKPPINGAHETQIIRTRSPFFNDRFAEKPRKARRSPGLFVGASGLLAHLSVQGVGFTLAEDHLLDVTEGVAIVVQESQVGLGDVLG